MAVTVEGPMVEDISASVDALGRPTVTTKYRVSGVEGEAHTRIFTALMAPGIPATGEAYPDSSVIAFVTGKNVEPMGASKNQFWVVVTYGAATAVEPPPDPNEPATVTVETNLQTVEVNTDIGGNKLVVEHENPPPPSGGPPEIIEQFVTGQVQRPQTVVTFETTGDDDSLAEGLAYVGKLNSGSFATQAAKRWLCTNIRSTTVVGSGVWRKSYQFQHDKDQWKLTAFFKDAKGNLPEDYVEGQDVRDFDVYDVADFGNLGLE